MGLEAEIALAKKLSRSHRPDTAIILGTGLGGMEQSMIIEESIPYSDCDGFPCSTVTSHAGKLLLGKTGKSSVVVMSGRFHLYEGYSAREATFPIRVFALMGIRRLFIACAAGGLRKDVVPGTPMLITDHINLSGTNPLIGQNEDMLGPRFPDMAQPYSRGLSQQARVAAKNLDIDLKEGVYVQVPGPSLETAAETRMLMRLGADAVGMSTVIEVIAAVHAGLEVLAIAAITNINDPDNYQGSTLEEVIRMAQLAAPSLASIFAALC